EEGYDILIPDPGGGYTKTHVNAPPYKLEEARYQWNLASQRAWEMWKGLDAAKTALEGYARSLSNLVGQKEDPLVLEAQVAAAEANMRVAEAAVREAQAALEALKEGATAEQKEVARAQVREAEALVQVLEAQRAKAEILAPSDALVLERLVHRGEAVTPGALLFRLAQLDTVYLTVYVAERDLGLVHLGQPVVVTVDSFPGRTFEGKVVHIATEAEFTPKNVQTREERVHMVFGVKVEIPNPEHLLKPGMPADAVIRTGSTP
ncbi:MAG: HlyD family secretion protein, partial [Anaerolineae bacterium]